MTATCSTLACRSSDRCSMASPCACACQTSAASSRSARSRSRPISVKRRPHAVAASAHPHSRTGPARLGGRGSPLPLNQIVDANVPETSSLALPMSCACRRSSRPAECAPCAAAMRHCQAPKASLNMTWNQSASSSGPTQDRSS